jgi:putative holliday junction resolvase
MGRLMGIDYGTKRTGIAVTDPMQMFGSGLTAVDTKDIFTFIANYILTEPLEKFIVGLPTNNDGSDTHNTQNVLQFIRALNNKYPKIPVETIDEAFTSKQAMQVLIQSGVKQKDRRNKKLIDEVSAALILQQYLGNSF